MATCNAAFQAQVFEWLPKTAESPPKSLHSGWWRESRRRHTSDSHRHHKAERIQIKVWEGWYGWKPHEKLFSSSTISGCTERSRDLTSTSAKKPLGKHGSFLKNWPQKLKLLNYILKSFGSVHTLSSGHLSNLNCPLAKQPAMPHSSPLTQLLLGNASKFRHF